MIIEDLKKELIKILDEKSIVIDSNTLNNYALSLNGTRVEPLAVIFPSNKKEVVDVVKLANELKFEIFTISKGKNWGYGSAQGSKPNQVILDFSLMNNIIDVDGELCTMTLEPGVTQNEAYLFLENNKEYSHLQLDVTGAGKEASIVGNML